MATMTVWKFTTADGAEKILAKLESLQKQELLTILDAAIVSWPQGKKKPKTRQAHSLTGAGALTGAFWGMLFGLIFFIPVFGLAMGAAMGALAGHFAKFGIDDDFIQQCRDKVTEGTSALFLYTANVVLDKVKEVFEGIPFELIQTNLSEEQEAQLLEAFSEQG